MSATRAVRVTCEIKEVGCPRPRRVRL